MVTFPSNTYHDKSLSPSLYLTFPVVPILQSLRFSSTSLVNRIQTSIRHRTLLHFVGRFISFLYQRITQLLWVRVNGEERVSIKESDQLSPQIDVCIKILSVPENWFIFRIQGNENYSLLTSTFYHIYSYIQIQKNTFVCVFRTFFGIFSTVGIGFSSFSSFNRRIRKSIFIFIGRTRYKLRNEPFLK